VIGTGYVGLVTGPCFADVGNHVECIDIDQEKIDSLNRAEIPIYEPGLSEVMARNARAGRLHFTTDLAGSVAAADIIYLAVGTPQAEDGSADLTALRTVVRQIASHLREDAIVVVKSTVPVGTNAEVASILRDLTGRTCDVASNPEFLKEGTALSDFTLPDRVIVGARTDRVADALRGLYEPFVDDQRPLLVMSPESAELTKYAANAMLAAKISFINEMANVCERAGGDIDDVRQGIGHDRRIGFSFLAPGVGYGGSCFPKDVRALAHIARSLGVHPQFLESVDHVNNRQKHVLAEKIERHFFGQLAGRTIAVWGLAFKPETDDVREAPAIVLIDRLLHAGARVRVHDPVAMDNVQRLYGWRVQFASDAMSALDGADALAINTEWAEYRQADLREIRQRLACPVLFDGRNIFDPRRAAAQGLTYHSVGRPDTKAIEQSSAQAYRRAA
jgi:UDPglucose 6-dehydrogenase